MSQLRESLVSLPSLDTKKLSLPYWRDSPSLSLSLSQVVEPQANYSLRSDNEWGQRRQGSQGTLKSDNEAMSSSSSLVAEEADIRVCWLEVTRCGLLISPWLTVTAGLQGRRCVSGEPGGQVSSTSTLGTPIPGRARLAETVPREVTRGKGRWLKRYPYRKTPCQGGARSPVKHRGHH